MKFVDVLVLMNGDVYQVVVHSSWNSKREAWDNCYCLVFSAPLAMSVCVCENCRMDEREGNGVRGNVEWSGWETHGGCIAFAVWNNALLGVWRSIREIVVSVATVIDGLERTGVNINLKKGG